VGLFGEGEGPDDEDDSEDDEAEDEDLDFAGEDDYDEGEEVDMEGAESGGDGEGETIAEGGGDERDKSCKFQGAQAESRGETASGRHGVRNPEAPDRGINPATKAAQAVRFTGRDAGGDSDGSPKTRAVKDMSGGAEAVAEAGGAKFPAEKRKRKPVEPLGFSLVDFSLPDSERRARCVRRWLVPLPCFGRTAAERT
jgi:hypothetical protein